MGERETHIQSVWHEVYKFLFDEAPDILMGDERQGTQLQLMGSRATKVER